MNILLTNDDGISSEGIQKLAQALRSNKKHRVFVVAPDENRSGISHAISILNNPVKLTPFGEDSWSCSGFPGDCVIAALGGALPLKPDLVLSGINRGANLGTDIIYSGTAAAARQASLSGLPGIALSLAGSGDFYWDMAVSWMVDHLDELLTFWKEETFVNVNIPNVPEGPKGIAVASIAVKDYKDMLKVKPAPDGGFFCILEAGEEFVFEKEGSDCSFVSRNYASVSTVSNYPAIKEG
jgi:5'-nucleotidase